MMAQTVNKMKQGETWQLTPNLFLQARTLMDGHLGVSSIPLPLFLDTTAQAPTPNVFTSTR